MLCKYQLNVFIIYLLLFDGSWTIKQTYDITMEKIQFNMAPDQKVLNGNNINVMGRNRVINGTVDLFEDVDDEHFTVSIVVYSDTSGNGEFRPLPYNISDVTPCEAIAEFGSYLEPSLQQGVNTNFPIKGDVCPVPKDTYYFNDIEVKTDNLPNHIPRGFLKGIGTLRKDGEYVGELEVLCRVEDKYV